MTSSGDQLSRGEVSGNFNQTRKQQTSIAKSEFFYMSRADKGDDEEIEAKLICVKLNFHFFVCRWECMYVCECSFELMRVHSVLERKFADTPSILCYKLKTFPKFYRHFPPYWASQEQPNTFTLNFIPFNLHVFYSGNQFRLNFLGLLSGCMWRVYSIPMGCSRQKDLHRRVWDLKLLFPPTN